MDNGLLIWRRRIVCAGSLLILLTGLLSYRLALKEKASEWVLSRRELAVQRKIAAIKQKNLDDYDDNLRALADAEAEMADVESLVAAYHCIPDRLSQIDAWLAECQLDILSFSASGYEELPGSALQDGQMIRVKAAVEGSGQYKDILLFFDKMDDASSYYSVDSFTLTASEPEGVRFGLDFSIYAYKKREAAIEGAVQ